MYRPEVASEMLPSFRGIEFADLHDYRCEIKIDILIGLDAYWIIIRPKILCIAPSGLVAKSSVFGWILYGSVASQPIVSASVSSVSSHGLLCFERVSGECLHRLLDLDFI